MKDVEIVLDHRPGALAAMGRALGAAGVSIEGGGGFVVNGQAVMHFLFDDGERARDALEGAGIGVVAIRDVVAVRLAQSEAGQLGSIAARMAAAAVNLEIVYSDHDGQLILVGDDAAAAGAVARAWTREREATRS